MRENRVDDELNVKWNNYGKAIILNIIDRNSIPNNYILKYGHKYIFYMQLNRCE